MSEKASKKISEGKKNSLLRKKFEENPFVTDGGFRVPLRRKTERIETHGPVSVVAGDETIGVAEIRKVSTVDSERFVKVFTDQLDQFYGLTPTALRIVTVLLHNLGQVRVGDGDKVYLNESEVSKRLQERGMKPPSQATYFRALGELVAKGFIAPSTQHPLFFINPAIFFNGDRVRFVTEIRKRKLSKQQALEKEGQERLPLDAESSSASSEQSPRDAISDFTGDVKSA